MADPNIYCPDCDNRLRWVEDLVAAAEKAQRMINENFLQSVVARDVEDELRKAISGARGKP